MFLFSPSLRIIEGLSIRILTYAPIADYLEKAEESDDPGVPWRDNPFLCFDILARSAQGFQPPSVAIE